MKICYNLAKLQAMTMCAFFDTHLDGIVMTVHCVEIDDIFSLMPTE